MTDDWNAAVVYLRSQFPERLDETVLRYVTGHRTHEFRTSGNDVKWYADYAHPAARPFQQELNWRSEGMPLLAYRAIGSSTMRFFNCMPPTCSGEKRWFSSGKDARHLFLDSLRLTHHPLEQLFDRRLVLDQASALPYRQHSLLKVTLFRG